MLMRHARSWMVMAAVPLCGAVVALAREAQAAGALAMSRPTLAALTADVSLYTACLVVVVAPLVGVGTVRRVREVHGHRCHHVPPLAVAWPLLASIACLVGASAALTLLGIGARPGAAAFVVASHATLAAVALALAVFGALCAAALRDPLDAAGCSLAVVLTAAGGLFAAGAWITDLPPRLLESALAANPLVAMVSSANIDIVRMDVLYRISPLAHVGVEYPAWHVACVGYLVAAAACFTGLTLTSGNQRDEPAMKGRA
jgi:hypothetical protein